MKSRKPTGSFAPQEVQRFILPITLTSIAIMVSLVLDNLINEPAFDAKLIIYGCIVSVGTVVNNAVIVHTANFRETYGWLNATLTGIGLGLLPYVLPDKLSELSHIMIILGTIAVTVISGRIYGYVALFGIFILGLPHTFRIFGESTSFLDYGVPYIVATVVMEAILRIKDTTQQHIHRLETINKVSRRIMLSLDTQQTISLLDATIQETLKAETYFIGILKTNELELDLFYDDGKYYKDVKLPLEGTLSGWVIKNQKELFLPDLRQDVDL